MKTREELIKYLEKRFDFVSTTEEFFGVEKSDGGVWVSGETNITYNGMPIYSYYADGESYAFGVLIAFENMLNKYGWYSQWYDPGTVHIYEI